jgi:molecular chaperone HscB
MNFSANYFELFGLPARFSVDRAALDRAYRELQGEVHPDRFAHAGDAEQRLAMQRATRVNEAYKTLREPLSRARYLLESQGIDLGTERNTAMPVDFLVEQMEWREAAEEARQASDVDALETLQRRLRDTLAERYRQLGAWLDDAESLQKNREVAATETRKLMFLEKFDHDLGEMLIDIEDAAT